MVYKGIKWCEDSTKREFTHYIRCHLNNSEQVASKECCRIPTGGNFRHHFIRDPTMGRKHLEAQSWNQYLRSGGNRFLFEFPNRTVVDHIVRGDWFWKSYKFSLQWWSPTSNASFERPNQVWIRVVELPLHLWSHKAFREIGNLCRGWTRTEEETELRNHLKWARLKVQGDGESIPSTVS